MGSGGGIRARAQVLAVCRQSTTKNWTRAKSRAHGSFLRILCKGMSLSHGNSYMMTLTLVQSDKTYPYMRGLSQGVKKKSGSNRSSCGASIRYGGEWPLYPHAQGRSIMLRASPSTRCFITTLTHSTRLSALILIIYQQRPNSGLYLCSFPTF